MGRIPKLYNLPGYVVLCAVLVLDARPSVAETHELKGSSSDGGQPAHRAAQGNRLSRHGIPYSSWLSNVVG
jgi:hypothetical protein